MPREFGRPAARGPHERHRRSRPSSTRACGAPGISGSHDSPGSRRVVPLLCAAGSPPRRAFGAHAGPPLGRPRIGARSAGDRSVPRRDRIARPARGAVYGRTGSLRDPARKDGWKALYPLRVQAYPIRVQESTPSRVRAVALQREWRRESASRPDSDPRLEKLQANDLPAVEPRRLPAADRRRRLAQRIAEHDGCLRPMLEEIDHRRSLACCE
jgi:hypothetical protein